MGLFVLKPVDSLGPGVLFGDRRGKKKTQEESFRGTKVDSLDKVPGKKS